MPLYLKILTVVVAVFLVEEINLVVEDLDTDQDSSLLFTAATKSFHFTSFCTLLVDVFMVICEVVILGVDVVEEEWQQDEVMVEVLEKVLVYLAEVKSCCWCLHIVL